MVDVLMVDVEVERVIDAPVHVVAAFAAEPSNAPKWYRRIDTAEWVTEPPLGVGSQVAFRARFLGRRLSYTYEVSDYVPGVRLTMTTAQGPFPMTTEYTWQAVGDGRTTMTLRNHGQPKGFSKIVSPLMAFAMKRAMRGDLRQLAELLEGG